MRRFTVQLGCPITLAIEAWRYGTRKHDRTVVVVVVVVVLPVASVVVEVNDGGMPDLRPLFSELTAAKTRPCLKLTPVAAEPQLTLDLDTVGLLRDGLGHFDMEVRWLAHLDEAHVLRFWRSWTGHQIYEATLDMEHGRITNLKVEQDNDRYRGDPTAEPEQFTKVLIGVVNTLRHFRAGHTPYGPAEGAGPVPPDWPPGR